MDLNGWAPAFACTLLVETPVYVLATRRALGVRGAILASFALNLATHPLAWTTITGAPRPLPAVFTGVELAVAAAEALLLFAAGRTRFSQRPLGMGRALAASIAANGFSAGLGLFL